MRQSRIALALVLGAALAFGGAAHAALIAHYPLDTASGGTTPDTTGTNGPGTLFGGPTPGSTGQIAQAFDFAGGTGEYVGISDPVWGKTAFTASVWFQPDGAGNQGPLGQWDNNIPRRSLLIRTSGGGTLETFLRSSGGTQIGGGRSFPSASVGSGAWNHAVVVYDGQNTDAFLNGEKSTTSYSFASSGTVVGQGTQGTMAIGSRGGSERTLNGRADDVAVFNTTLSDGKIRALYTTAVEPGLNYHASQANQLFDRFDAGTGSTTIDTKTWQNAWGLTGGEGDVTDLGGGRYTLTLDTAGNGLSTTRSPGDAFGVDFGSSDGSGGGPGGVQPNFGAFEDTESGGTPPVANSYASTLGQDGTVDVEVGNYTHFRDYSAIASGPFAGRSALLSDMVLRNADGALNLSLSNLRPGTYQLTTFHHSTQFGGGNIDTRLFDANGLNQVVSNNVPVTGGTSPSQVTTQTFTIEAGGSDVTVAFQGSTSAGHNSLNGFRIDPIHLPDVIVRKTALLSVDINDRGATGATNTQAGFSEFVIAGGSGGTTSYGSYTVTVSHAAGGGIDDRRRGQPTNSGAFTEQELLRDFIFANGTESTDGLDVLVQGLASDELYEVVLWSFDDGSGGNRLSDWYANGILAYDDYRFNGDRVPPAPASNDIYSFRFLALSDGSGDLLLSGLAAGGGNPNVFLNAFQINQVELIPEPATLSLLAFGGLALLRRRKRSSRSSSSSAHGSGVRTLAVLLAVLCALGLGTAQASVVLQVDIDDKDTTDVAAGFGRLTVNDGGFPNAVKTFAPSGITVDVDPVGFTFSDEERHRTSPTGFPQAAVYRDFLFGDGSTSATVGYDTTLTGLRPNHLYDVTVWSFDTGSANDRASDWHVTASSGRIQVKDNYIFDGGNPPTADADNRFTVQAVSDANGQIVLQGRGDPGASAGSPAVFLNGIALDDKAPLALQTELAVDMNNRGNTGATFTQPGFAEFVLADTTSTTRSYGGIDVTLTAVTSGSSLGDRHRTSPTNGGSFTQQELLRDFIFASNVSGVDEQLDILIEGLVPNQPHVVTLWSFDTGSGGNRVSDWLLFGNQVVDNYVFNGSVLPADNAAYSFSFPAFTNAAGEILLSGIGRVNDNALFVDALKVEQLVPEPGTLSLLGLGGLGLLRRRRRKMLVLLLAVGLALGAGASADAAPLLVDIGESISGTVTPQAGWNAALGGGAHSFVADFGTGGGGGNEVTVTLDAPFFRSTPHTGYPQVTGTALDDLLSGAMLTNSAADTFTARLTNLEPGTYSATTYHHSNYSGGAGLGRLDLVVDDALRAYATKHNDVPVTAGTSSPSFTTRTTEFTVTAGGYATLILDADTGTDGSNHATLNGFQLDKLSADTGDAVPITNASFESPDLTSGSFTDTDPTGWVGNNDFGGAPGQPRVGTIHENRGSMPLTPDGEQWAFLQHDTAQLGQRIGDIGLLGDVWELSYLVSHRTNENLNVDHLVHVIAGSPSTYVGGVTVATEVYDLALAASGTFNVVDMQFTPVGATGGFSDLWLVFENDASGQLMLDSVALTTTPEPGTLSLLGLGGLALLRRRQRTSA
jgi:hypothetical protein